ncbi:MAG: hypothetical protein OYL97_17745 [Candidatus Poribacteria bacterium]|nr:hypothetical protein [Candidatus Poribacteria bacterium]
MFRFDEDILVDRAYSCFKWGQIATTYVNEIHIKSPRRVYNLHLMESPRLERYILDHTAGNTYMNLDAFNWDAWMPSDWLLPASETSAPAAPHSTIQRTRTTMWAEVKDK